MFRFVCVLVLAGFLGCAAADGGIDFLTGVIRDVPCAAGLPLGGIGTGAIHIQSDGSIEALTCNNNRRDPILTLPGCFFGLRVTDGKGLIVRQLQHQSSIGWNTVERTVFEGLFPVARTSYSDSRLPMDIAVEVFSPLVPHRAEDASLPVVLWTFHIASRLDRELHVTLIASWENQVGVGGGRQRPIRSREGCVQEFYATDALFGLRFRNLAPRQPALEPALGEYALAVVKDEHLLPTVAQSWDAVEDQKAFWNHFVYHGALSGWSSGAQASERPAGAVAASFLLAPQHTITCTFLFAWYLPNTGYALNAYAREFMDAWSVAEYAAANRTRLARDTQSWHALLRRSSLPVWYQNFLINAAQSSTTHGAYTADGRVRLPDCPARDRLIADGFTSLFFPSLACEDLLFRINAMRWAGGGGQEICDLVLRAYRDYRWTGNQRYVEETLEPCLEAVQRLSQEDRDANGLPHSIAGNEARWVLALRSLTAMAEVAGNAAAASRVRSLLDGAGTALRKIQPAPVPGRLDQLTAAWYAQLLGMDPVEERSVLREWLHDLAHPSDPSLLLPLDEPARSATETSLPQALTAGCALQLYEGNPDVGWCWLENAARAAIEFGRSPFEYGRLYHARSGARLDTGPDAAAAAAWYTLPALLGLGLDTPNHTLTLAPRLPSHMRQVHAPVFVPNWWGWLEYEVDTSTIRLALTIERVFSGGVVDLSAFRTRSSTGAVSESAIYVAVNGQDTPVRAVQDGEMVRIEFSSTLSLAPGDRLVVTLPS